MAIYKIYNTCLERTQIDITFDFHLSRNDLRKHKSGQKKNNIEANLWNKIESQNDSQLRSHRFGRKCALAFDSKSVSKLVYESLFLFV